MVGAKGIEGEEIEMGHLQDMMIVTAQSKSPHMPLFIFTYMSKLILTLRMMWSKKPRS